MAHIICMDGLGGCPRVTFRHLSKVLKGAGHSVSIVDVDGIETHEDRIQRVLDAFENAEQATGEKIFLLGQSAGGGAIRAAAESLSGNKRLGGIILLSQSMPRWRSYMTQPLLRTMIGRIKDLFLGRTIIPTEVEYTKIAGPIALSHFEKVVTSRIPLPGLETRELAFYPRKLENLSCPTLAIFGSEDRWISPRAHRKLCEDLEERMQVIECHEISGAGHLTLASKRSEEVIQIIKNWIEKS